ncbi:UbiX family flavin prenyltransferase [Candidatus Micrarchaeota archaeon]|nr:UbiX family flavin prenyltransferase [Candidatus Micrarchaeota archaeon]
MRIVLAITGASGLQYGVRLHQALRELGHDVWVVHGSGAKTVSEAEEVEIPWADFGEKEMGAPPASGSHPVDGMVVAPCSLKTLGEIANGIGSNLVSRSAEVVLKERRKLVLVVRETPLSYIAIKNMEKVTLAGGVVLPACPAFYSKPKSVEEIVDFVCGKTLDQFGIEHKLYKRWKSPHDLK